MKKIERKDFLMLAGGAVGGSLVGTVFSGAPFDALQWLVEWTQDQYVPPVGEVKLIQSICQVCPGGCNITVKKVGDRAVKIEPSNDGCPMGQLALQMLYHPERIRYPLKRSGKKGSAKFEPVSWETALKDIAVRMDALRKDGKTSAIAAINSDKPLLSAQLLERLVKAAGSLNLYRDYGFDSLTGAVVNATQNVKGSLHYDFENSDYILSFGARLLEGWGDPARMQKALVSWKKNGARLVQVDTIGTRTASMADTWIAIKPGTEAILAMGIAYYLIKMGRGSNGANFAAWSQIVLNQYTPEKVSALTGVKAARIEEIAKGFANARAAVAVAGRGGKGVSSSTAEIVAVQALNSLVGSFGRRGGVFVKTAPGLGEPPMDAIAAAGARKSKVAKGIDDFIKNGEAVELLFVNEADPVHRSAYGKMLAQKMEKIPMIVAFAPLINDTAAYADYVLPTISSLEMPTPKGDAVMAPRYKAMCSADIILKLAKKVKDIGTAFPWGQARDVARAAGRPEVRAAANFSFPVELFKNYLADFVKKIGAKDYPLALVPYEISMVGDGYGLAFPYALKFIDGKTLTGRKLWVQMNPETAKKHGVCEGSSIDLVSRKGEVGSVKVHLTKTVAPETVAVPLGFGHARYTEYARKKGVNPKEIMSDDIDPVTGTADWWFTRIKIS